MDNKDSGNILSNKDFIETINNLDVIYFRGEFKGKLLFHNTALNKMLGLDTSIDLTGSRSSQFFSDSKLREKYYNKLDIKGYIKDFIVKINNSKGEERYLLVNSRITKDNMHRSKIIEGTAIDITEKHKLENKLKEINRLKSEFLRRACHELKTPLVSIKGFSELILSKYSEDLNADIISDLDEISKGCERLQSIINNLLQTSKMESTEYKPKLEREDLSFLINYCAEELHPLFAKREHSLNIEIPETMITEFEKEEIHDVISNLLINAIKYTPPKGWIDIRAEILDNFIVISIKDNGIGFTEEEKSKIFQQFGKVEHYGHNLDLGIDGSGLGLYISKKIVESHGGKIWMESEGRNKGSTFYFSLPLIKD